jgi:hypothetical protein
MTTTLHDKAYRCWRYFDELEAKKYIDDEPVFFPNTAINLEGDVKFRIVINYPIYYEDGEKNNRIVPTPWKNEEMNYKKASWLGADKIINDHSDYVLIVKSKFCRSSGYEHFHSEYIERITEICEKANKKYKVMFDDEDFRYKDAYEYFIG